MQGSCACKSIQYQIHKTPKACGYCYCKSCQRTSGSDRIVYLACDIDSVEVEGNVKWYLTKGESGLLKKKGFCPECGSNLFGKPDYWPHLMIVYAGSLLDTSFCSPEKNLWIDDAPLWTKIDESLKTFPQNPL